MQAKMETAAERYRRHKKETEVIHDIECPECKMVWKGRRADKDFWVSSGLLPTHFVEGMIAATRKGAKSDAELAATLSEKELIGGIEFSSAVVKYTAVEPRIVEKIEGPNDITQDEVMTCCYKALRDWQIKGGDGAKGLETFRQG